MKRWDQMSSDEQLLIVKSEIYSYLKPNSEHWVDRGYLNKKFIYNERGKKQRLYRLTEKAISDLISIFTKKVKIRFEISYTNERLKKIRKNKNEYNLLDLMEA